MIYNRLIKENLFFKPYPPNTFIVTDNRKYGSEPSIHIYSMPWIHSRNIFLIIVAKLFFL